MLRAILNKSWRQHSTKQQPYGHLPPVTKTIKIRRTRHAGHCWRSRNELVSDVLPGRAKAGRPDRTYIQQLCADTGCIPEDLPKAMDDREGWRERVRNIRANSTTWWWWWWWIIKIIASYKNSYSIIIMIIIIIITAVLVDQWVKLKEPCKRTEKKDYGAWK